MEHGDLLRYLGAARWFGGKGRPAEVTSVAVLPWLSEPGTWPAVRVEVAQVRYLDTGEVDLYQLPISYRPTPSAELDHGLIGRAQDLDLGPVLGYDAVIDPEACALILSRFRSASPSTGSGSGAGSGSVVFHGTDLSQVKFGDRPLVFGGQQSNSSIMYGDHSMLKLFRRLEVGRNLDIEIHQQLTHDRTTGSLARLFGWIEAEFVIDDQPVSTDLGMLVEQLRDAKDGWELALECVEASADFSQPARDLGAALAEIHRLLAQDFAATRIPGDQVAQTMINRLDAAAKIIPDLLPLRSGLLRRFDALRDHDIAVQRVHGDFHLGQTLHLGQNLHTPGGWKIIDFEGEPVKSMAERRLPDSPLRDVAGLLRSLDYAAAIRPGGNSRAWASKASEAFLEGYGPDSYGPDSDGRDGSRLQAYLADKAIYEAVYEVRNRPDWAAIPLTALAELASGADLSTESDLTTGEPDPRTEVEVEEH